MGTILVGSAGGQAAAGKEMGIATQRTLYMGVGSLPWTLTITVYQSSTRVNRAVYTGDARSTSSGVWPPTGPASTPPPGPPTRTPSPN